MRRCGGAVASLSSAESPFLARNAFAAIATLSGLTRRQGHGVRGYLTREMSVRIGETRRVVVCLNFSPRQRVRASPCHLSPRQRVTVSPRPLVIFPRVNASPCPRVLLFPCSSCSWCLFPPHPPSYTKTAVNKKKDEEISLHPL